MPAENDAHAVAMVSRLRRVILDLMIDINSDDVPEDWKRRAAMEVLTISDKYPTAPYVKGNFLPQEEFNTLVYQGVLAVIKDRPWFNGVCMDTLKESYDSYRRGTMTIERAIEVAEMDTEWWSR